MRMSQFYRILAICLLALFTGSVSYLVVEGPTANPESEMGLYLLAAAIFMPPLSLLALGLEVRHLARVAARGARKLSTLERAAIWLTGPVGLAWAAFRLTSEKGGGLESRHRTS
jgi:hypothetical protein